MTRRTGTKIACLGLAALLCLLALPGALAAEKWLHVRVDESGPRGERVSVNIPLGVVERMLPLISVDELQKGKLQIDVDEDLQGIDLRELAAALHDAPDAEFVTVESDEETVHVSKEGNFLLVRAEESDGGSNEKIRVRLPLALVDALVGDDPGELDLIAALDVLGDYDGDALVDIESDDTAVRVWIDSSASGR